MVGALFFVPSWLSRSCRNHSTPKLVELGCDEGAVRVENHPTKLVELGCDEGVARVENHPTKLVELGCDEGVVRVETIPSRSWLSWAATKERPVSKPW